MKDFKKLMDSWREYRIDGVDPAGKVRCELASKSGREICAYVSFFPQKNLYRYIVLVENAEGYYDYGLDESYEAAKIKCAMSYAMAVREYENNPIKRLRFR